MHCDETQQVGVGPVYLQLHHSSTASMLEHYPALILSGHPSLFPWRRDWSGPADRPQEAAAQTGMSR